MTTPKGHGGARRSFFADVSNRNNIMMSASLRGITNMAETTEELLAYDKLAERDKELLEKSQLILSQSYLRQLEKKEAVKEHGSSTRKQNERVSMSDKVHQQRKLMMDRKRQDEQSQNVTNLINEIDMIQYLHQKQKNKQAAIAQKQMEELDQKWAHQRALKAEQESLQQRNFVELNSQSNTSDKAPVFLSKVLLERDAIRALPKQRTQDDRESNHMTEHEALLYFQNNLRSDQPMSFKKATSASNNGDSMSVQSDFMRRQT